jgi:hypothetical protein
LEMCACAVRVSPIWRGLPPVRLVPNGRGVGRHLSWPEVWRSSCVKRGSDSRGEREREHMEGKWKRKKEEKRKKSRGQEYFPNP